MADQAAAAAAAAGEQRSAAGCCKDDLGRGTAHASSSGSTGGQDAGNFECNICLELANDPVITLCGHLFCWTCLYRWLRVHCEKKECPVCKAGVEESSVIPLYGRGKAQSDPRKKAVPDSDVPQRPQGRRPVPTRNPNAPGRNGFPFFPNHGGPFATAQLGGITFSAGFGLFPALLGMHFQTFPGFNGGAAAGPAAHGGQGDQVQADNQQQEALSKLLFFLGMIVVFVFLFI